MKNLVANLSSDKFGDGKKNQRRHMVDIILIFCDIIIVNFSYFIALWLRFDCHISKIPSVYLDSFVRFSPIYTILCIFIFYKAKLYRSIWKFASYMELLYVIIASIITFVIQIVGITFLYGRMPITYYVLGALLQFLYILGIRFSYRFVLLQRTRIRSMNGKNVMVIGAGMAGRMIIRDIIKAKEICDRVCCVIDDDNLKWGRTIDGIPVVGGRRHILDAVKKYQIEKIYVAIPSASMEEKKEIFNICKDTHCELRNLPGMYQLVNGEVSVSAMKEVAIEDLLGREQIKIVDQKVCIELLNKAVLVTGGGGSIGSELCRQIAQCKPKELIIFDIYENNAYEIQQELKRKYPDLNLTVLIGSVRDKNRVDNIFKQHRPDIVYHAAAHKHVPLMEDSPNEAIKNNVLGTYNVAYAAMAFGCERFVLISTDKAVNPTNIMGASKRICEMIIQSFDRLIKNRELIKNIALNIREENSLNLKLLTNSPRKTEFVAVRFGNVLGSNGSVIPLFKKQIMEGGPVTVTHPNIIRYFMTIPEAVSLVLQAGNYAEGGEIFVLDMGEPVKIDTLARNLIKLSGFKPDVDIKIEYTGLRPGEKLFEEKLMAEEGLKETESHLIHIGCPIPFDTDEFLKGLQDLITLCYQNSDFISEKVEEIVSTYQPKKQKQEFVELERKTV